jgi:YHS domain-containing protein
MTRGAAIEYELKKSPYTVTENGTKYFFSSQLHADKFRERLEEKRNQVNYSLSNRFNMHIKLDVIADIMLYVSIEKRGFYILTEGGPAKCLSSIALNGGKLTLRKPEEQ